MPAHQHLPTFDSVQDNLQKAAALASPETAEHVVDPASDKTEIAAGKRQFTPEDVIRYLEEYVSPDRRRRIRDVVAHRRRGLATVVEGLYDMGNVSAVMRTAEGLGILPFHVIATGQRFKESNRTSQGADKWLEVVRWGKPEACVASLQHQGYQVVATDLDADCPLAEIDFSRPTALVFGNEAEGISETMRVAADVRCLLPMYGFVQSYNISVAAALTLGHAHAARTRATGDTGDLTESEQVALTATYYLKSVKHHERILERIASGR